MLSGSSDLADFCLCFSTSGVNFSTGQLLVAPATENNWSLSCHRFELRTLRTSQSESETTAPGPAGLPQCQQSV